VRFRRALLAGLLAGGAAYAPVVRAQSPAPPAPPAPAAPEPKGLRDEFGLPPAAAPVSPVSPAPAPAPAPKDLRDEFGLSKPSAPVGPADCSDGLAFGCAMATDPLDEATPYALSTWLPARALLRLPVGHATHDAVASFALGASRDGAGVVLGGATGLDNRWMIDGAPAESVRTGAADTRVPLAFLEGMWVTAGGFAARDRASVGGAIDARLLRGTPGHELAADAWLSLGRAPRARPPVPGSYTVRELSIDPGAELTAQLVGTGPIAALGARLGGTVWYAAGIAPSVSTAQVRWRASRLVDADDDGVPDAAADAPGDLAVATVERTTERTFDVLVPAMARLGLDRGAHRVELTLVGDFQRDARFLGNATKQAAGVDRRTLTGDAIATWRGRWAETRARVQLSWHRSDRHESARDAAAAGVPQLLTGYVPAGLADDPVLAAACDDASPDDPATRIANCPVLGTLFASGGAGQLIDSVGDRPAMAVDVARRFGRHVVRVGGAFEDARLVTTTRFTASEQQLALEPGQLDRRRFYDGDCGDAVGDPCDYASGSQLNYRTRYAALYAENTFTLAPGLRVNDGLRWELMWLGSRLQFSHQIAPRFGMVWDPLGGGRSRVWVSLGRTFAMLPAGLGATLIRRDATVDDFVIAGVSARLHDAGNVFRIAPGVRSIAQDELTLGGQVALAGALRATLWAQGRYIGHGLETTRDGFDNPGKGGDPAATRETEMIAAALELVATKVSIRAGVMWGRTVGTWAGPFDPRLGFNLLQSPDWDADAANLDGALPTDAGGRAFVEAEQRGTLGPVAIAVATRLTVGSGRPRSVLADGIDGIVQLLPRGSAGRNPVVSQADVRLAAIWRGVAVTLDVFNLFDRREVTNLDEIYTRDTVRPIAGGSAADLVFLKNEVGTPAIRRSGFQIPIAFQDPLSISLGVHRAF
jgi:hypothetical protein